MLSVREARRTGRARDFVPFVRCGADTETEPGRTVVPQQPEPVTEIARRDQLVDSAIRLIAEQGHARASLSRIAEQAGGSKAALLYYFKTKDDLLDAVLARVLG